MKKKMKAITEVAPTTNITEAIHMIALIGYYRKFFPLFSYMIQLLTELIRKNVLCSGLNNIRKALIM